MMKRWVWCVMMAALLAGGTSACCGGEETTETSADDGEGEDEGAANDGDGDDGDDGDDDDDDDGGESAAPARKPARLSVGGPPVPGESRSERLARLAQGDLAKGFDVTILRAALVEGTSRNRFGRRESGIQLQMSGAIRNNTGKTLSGGFVNAVLIVNFGADVVKVRLGADGLKPEIDGKKPWRDGRARFFEVETFVFPEVMLEYTPTSAQARLMVVAEDPVDFTFEGPVWSMNFDWLSARGAPVKGKARVVKSEKLRVGPRGKTSGATEQGSAVELLYQKGEFFRVRSGEDVGWVSHDNILFEDLKGLHTGASPQGGDKSASDEAVSFTVNGMENLARGPEGAKLKDGERVFVIDVSLENKGEKDIKCADFFVDFGPKEQRTPERYTSDIEGAISCEKGKLPPGESVTGKLAFTRARHQVPFAVGFSSPTKRYLLVDVYDKAQAAPYTR